MIVKCECFEIRPIDRDYNKKGKPRETQVEILGGGYAQLSSLTTKVKLGTR